MERDGVDAARLSFVLRLRFGILCWCLIRGNVEQPASPLHNVRIDNVHVNLLDFAIDPSTELFLGGDVISYKTPLTNNNNFSPRLKQSDVLALLACVANSHMINLQLTVEKKKTSLSLNSRIS